MQGAGFRVLREPSRGLGQGPLQGQGLGGKAGFRPLVRVAELQRAWDEAVADDEALPLASRVWPSAQFPMRPILVITLPSH